MDFDRKRCDDFAGNTRELLNDTKYVELWSMLVKFNQPSPEMDLLRRWDLMGRWERATILFTMSAEIERIARAAARAVADDARKFDDEVL